MSTSVGGIPETHDEALRATLKSQYHAALAMLRESIERCPDELWLDDEPRNAFWQVAYHALFFTHLYMQPRLEAFRPWEGHQAGVQHEDGIPGPADPESELPLIPEPYTREQALAYWQECDAMVDDTVEALDLHSAESGFYWYPIPKLEHQLVSLRHLQHHTAQLADRLRAAADIGIRWVGARRR
jgi:DinB superfamily